MKLMLLVNAKRSISVTGAPYKTLEKKIALATRKSGLGPHQYLLTTKIIDEEKFYLPFQLGALFSAKATGPSIKSSLPNNSFIAE